MINSSFLWPMVIVSLPTVNLNDVFNKPDYTIPYCDCQQNSYKDSMNQGYIKSEELIEYNHNKYQDIIP
jgi:hypothetical protein